MTSCPEGRVCLFMGFLLIWIAGCGSVFKVEEPFQGDIPKANSHVAEIVILSALEKAVIPGGQGARVSLKIENSGPGNSITEIVLPEYLQKNGYRVSEKDVSIPEFSVSVDTLYVNLEREKNAASTINRFAAANIRVVLTAPVSAGGTKKVFIGSAEYQDSFPRQMIEASGIDEPYINLFPSEKHIVNKIKPILLGVTMTALVWLIYSYRG